MKCLTCKKEIRKEGRKGRGKNFCSRECFNNGSTRKVYQKGNIPFLKGKKRPPRSVAWRKKLSVSHRGQKSWNKGKKYPAISGEKHYNWKGGVTPVHTQIRMSLEYKLWKDSVFARDGYICQKYGVRGGELVAHHILNFAQYPELRFAIDNGATLSVEAHRKFHKKYGMNNNTREQLQEFLTEASGATGAQVRVVGGTIINNGGALVVQ